MEERDVVSAQSGISEALWKEIAAQYAIIDSAIKLINQHHQRPNGKQQNEPSFAEWVYNMDLLDKWIHEYTKRKKLNCPNCKSEQVFNCNNCGNKFEYHDEL